MSPKFKSSSLCINWLAFIFILIRSCYPKIVLSSWSWLSWRRRSGSISVLWWPIRSINPIIILCSIRWTAAPCPLFRNTSLLWAVLLSCICVLLLSPSIYRFNTCLLSDSEKEECFGQLASTTIPLLLTVCQKSFKSIENNGKNTPIFMVNTLEQLRKTFVTYSFTVDWVVKCTDELEYWLEIIIHDKVFCLLKCL